MDSNNYLNFLAVLQSVKNLTKSFLSEEDTLMLECFVLLLRKDGVLNNSYEGRLNKYVETFDELVKDTNDEKILYLYNTNIRHLFISAKPKYLDLLISTFNNITDSFIKKNASNILEYLLKVFYNNHKTNGDALQPKELTKIINHFVDANNESLYFNPFAGLGSLALNLPKKVTYLGEELVRNNQVLGEIRMLINECPVDYKFRQTNSIENFVNDYKYDFIAFNPPFNLKIMDHEYDRLIHENKYFNKNNANALIISECFKKLNDNGKMVFVMPDGFLYSRSTKEKALKKYLVDNGYIQSIIALPPNVLSFSSISVNVIVLCKSKDKNSKIRFVDATKLSSIKSSKQNIIDSDKVIALIEEQNYNEFVKDVTINIVAENNYNLSVNRFVFEDLGLSVEENEKLVSFSSLGTIIKPNKPKTDKCKLVRVGDLANDNIEYTKSFEDIEERKFNGKGLSVLESGALLLSIFSNNLRPTIYLKKNENIYYMNHVILAFKINTDVVNSDYLVLELFKEYVNKQLNSKRLGNAVQRVLKVDLLNLKIVLPSLDEQLIIVNKHRSEIISKKQEAFKKLVKSYNLDVADENSFLRHQIAGTLKNVRGSIKAISQIINEQIVSELPGVLEYKKNPKLDTTLFDYLNILERDITNITKSVNVVGQEIDLIELKVSKFNILDFLINYVNEVKDRGSNLFEISLNLDKHLLVEKQVKGIFLHGDKEFLRRVFNNIIENAEKHAFSNTINATNKIEVELIYSFEDSEIQIDFGNTGKPLPANFSHEAFIRKGSKAGANSGDGLGGWFINEVMKLHNGNFSFIDETGLEGINSEIVTTMELTFPIDLIL